MKILINQKLNSLEPTLAKHNSKAEKIINSLTEDIKIRPVQNTIKNTQPEPDKILPKEDNTNSNPGKTQDQGGFREGKEQKKQTNTPENKFGKTEEVTELQIPKEENNQSQSHTPPVATETAVPRIPENSNPAPSTPPVLNSAQTPNIRETGQQNAGSENGFNFVTSALISRHALAKQDPVVPKNLGKGYETATLIVLLIAALSIYLSIRKYLSQRA